MFESIMRPAPHHAAPATQRLSPRFSCAPRAGAARPFVRALVGCALLSLAACSSVSFKRDTQTSGTFESSGSAFTIMAIDIPKPAIDIARENASDANLANMVVEEVKITPYLGAFDWLLDIIGWRRVVIRGRWGFRGDD